MEWTCKCCHPLFVYCAGFPTVGTKTIEEKEVVKFKETKEGNKIKPKIIISLVTAIYTIVVCKNIKLCCGYEHQTIEKRWMAHFNIKRILDNGPKYFFEKQQKNFIFYNECPPQLPIGLGSHLAFDLKFCTEQSF